MNYAQAIMKFNSMSIDEISATIHPYVARKCTDSDAEYFRKMIRFVMVSFNETQ
jgi:hypothetical protein